MERGEGDDPGSALYRKSIVYALHKLITEGSREEGDDDASPGTIAQAGGLRSLAGASERLRILAVKWSMEMDRVKKPCTDEEYAERLKKALSGEVYKLVSNQSFKLMSFLVRHVLKTWASPAQYEKACAEKGISLLAEW